MFLVMKLTSIFFIFDEERSIFPVMMLKSIFLDIKIFLNYNVISFILNYVASILTRNSLCENMQTVICKIRDNTLCVCSISQSYCIKVCCLIIYNVVFSLELLLRQYLNINLSPILARKNGKMYP